MPKVYEAYSLLRVRPDPWFPGAPEKRALNLFAHTRLLKSPIAIDQALAEPRIGNLPWVQEWHAHGEEVEQLARRIEFRGFGYDPDGTPLLLQISMKGSDPEQLAVLVNAVTHAYLEKVVDRERKDLLAEKDILERIYTAKVAQVRRKREQIYQLARLIGGENPRDAAQRELLADYRLHLGTALTDAKMSLLQKQIALKQFERLHPVKESKVESLVPDKKPVQSGVRIDRAAAEQENLVLELDAAKMALGDLEKEYVDVSEKVDELGMSTTDLENWKAELAIIAATTNKLGAALEDYELELARGERVTLLIMADVPRVPVEDTAQPAGRTAGPAVPLKSD